VWQPRVLSALTVLVVFATNALSIELAAQATVGAGSVDVQNQLFDPETGTITFDIVNDSSVPLTAYTYEVRFTRNSGEEVVHQKSEDFAGTAQLPSAAPGDLSITVPEELLPIPAKGRRTIRENLRAPDPGLEAGDPSVRAVASIRGALFADGDSFGVAETVKRIKQTRVDRAEKLGAYVAALKAADRASERDEVLRSLASEAGQRPAARDWLLQLKAQLEAMPGDVHEHLRDLIAMMEAQRTDQIR
jgi:hypothetical protein